MSTSIDQQFVEFIAKSLVSQPEAVVVERRIDERGVLLELTVAPEDLGRVIGKHGATAQSLRTLLRALGTKNDARYNLKIVDSDQPAEQQNSPAPRATDEHDERQGDQPVAASAWSNDSNGSSSDAGDDGTDDSGNPSDHQPEPDVLPSEPEQIEEEPSHNSMVDKTRKELAELDDLDV